MNRAEGHLAVRSAVKAAAVSARDTSRRCVLKALDAQLEAILAEGCSKRSLKTWCEEVGVCAGNLKVYGKELRKHLRRNRKLIVPRAVLKTYPTLKAIMVEL